MSKFNGLKPPGFKPATWVDHGRDYNDETGETLSGICCVCNQWSAELKDKFCLDDGCKDLRRNKLIAEGKAFRVIDGLAGGDKILETKEGKFKIK